MLLKIIIFIIFVLFDYANCGALIWGNQNLQIPSLKQFNNEDLDLLTENLNNPKIVAFQGDPTAITDDLKELFKNKYTAYIPNTDLSINNILNLDGNGFENYNIIKETLDENIALYGDNILTLLISSNKRTRRDAEDEPETPAEESPDENEKDKEIKGDKEEAKEDKEEIKEEVKEETKDGETKEEETNIEEIKDDTETKDDKEPKDDRESKETKEEEAKEDEEIKEDKEPKEVKEAKEMKYQGEPSSGPILYSANGKAMIYTSKPPELTTNTSKWVLGKSSFAVLDKRGENLSRLSVTIPVVDGKVTIRFKFPWNSGYWSLSSVELLDTESKTYTLFLQENVVASRNFSYHCNGWTVFVDKENEIELKLFDIQAQPDTINGRFDDAFDCVTFTTAPIWSGLFVTSILIIVLGIGLGALNSIKTMDKFDNYKTKQLSITVAE